ncbi:MAG: DNA-binding protein WhiA [Clostridiales bacterium]|jgi:DNA-binding protein WhiA|nr:DNA-binding protein WhiA [Clostridiales bacterium]
MSFSSETRNELKKAEDAGRTGQARYIRRMFAEHGYVADPYGEYHLEFLLGNEAGAKRLMAALAREGFSAGIVRRKGESVLYLKEGDAIARLLRLMGASAALLKFEAARVEKTVNNGINRSANFAAANANKSITASVGHVAAIRRIERTMGLSSLPPGLRETAVLRLAKPEASLAEIGAAANPPLSKSGVSRRLSRIARIAEDIGANDGFSPMIT